MLFGKYRFRYPLDHKILGDLSFKLGKLDDAIFHYKKEIENQIYEDEILSIDDIGDVYIIEELYNSIVQVYLKKKDYKNAIIYCKKIIENDEKKERNKASGVLILSDIYVKIGKNDKALDLLKDLLDYEKECIEEDLDWDYPKQMYMEACCSIVKLLDGEERRLYLDKAMNFYEENKDADLGIKMAEILKIQSVVYKQSLKYKKYDEILKTIELICRNCILRSNIYMESYENFKAKKSINEGLYLYKRYNLNDYRLNFDLTYQRAYVAGESYDGEDDSKRYNYYLEAFKILEENNFFDEYKKNIILDKLAYYCEDFEISSYYKNKCDYYYLAKYKVEHDKNWIISFVEAFDEAGRDYMYCKNYDMAIKCYKKALYNLTSCGLFTGEFYEEEINLSSFDKYHISYQKYMSLCKNLSQVYKEKREYEEAIKYLKLKIECVKEHFLEKEFNSYKYLNLLGIYNEIKNILILKSDYQNSIKYNMISIGLYNSSNIENKVSTKSKDIENLFKLLNEDKINDYILSEDFTINLSSKYLNSLIYEIENLLKITKDTKIIHFCTKNLKLIKDTPFDI